MDGCRYYDEIDQLEAVPAMLPYATLAGPAAFFTKRSSRKRLCLCRSDSQSSHARDQSTLPCQVITDSILHIISKGTFMHNSHFEVLMAEILLFHSKQL